jgi:hypothetical protein
LYAFLISSCMLHIPPISFSSICTFLQPCYFLLGPNTLLSTLFSDIHNFIVIQYIYHSNIEKIHNVDKISGSILCPCFFKSSSLSQLSISYHLFTSPSFTMNNKTFVFSGILQAS